MEEIIKSEYEDVYRVTDGVTLHVKKYGKCGMKRLVDIDALN